MMMAAGMPGWSYSETVNGMAATRLVEEMVTAWRLGERPPAEVYLARCADSPNGAE